MVRSVYLLDLRLLDEHQQDLISLVNSMELPKEKLW